VAGVLHVLPVAALLALVLALAKPWLFRTALRAVRTKHALATEAAWRLGQVSEFALVIAMLAVRLGHVSRAAFEMILVMTLISFVISTYLVVLRYPTPLGVSARLRQG
jgi:predicted Kef-type K+ transport protein